MTRGREGALQIEAGVTSDPLSGSKSGSGGSTAGQATISNTQASHNKRHKMMWMFSEASKVGCNVKTFFSYEMGVCNHQHLLANVSSSPCFWVVHV